MALEVGKVRNEQRWMRRWRPIDWRAEKGGRNQKEGAAEIWRKLRMPLKYWEQMVVHEEKKEWGQIREEYGLENRHILRYRGLKREESKTRKEEGQIKAEECPE